MTPTLIALVFAVAPSLQPSSQPSSQPAPASQPSTVAPDEAEPPLPASQPVTGTTAEDEPVIVESDPAPAEEPPLRLREDVLPWTSFAAGMGLTVGGMLVAFIGAWPALNILREQAILADVNSRAFQEGDQSLIALRNAAIYDRNLAFQQWGAPVLAAGVGMVLCGALIAAGGLYTGVKLTAGE